MIFPGALGRLHAGLARLLRWKPAGKPVQPIIAAAPDAAMMDKRLAGTIIQTVWNDSGYQEITRKECPVIRLDQPVDCCSICNKQGRRMRDNGRRAQAACLIQAYAATDGLTTQTVFGR